LTDEVLKDREIEKYVASWQLLPSKGGVFEVTVNGELLFSKKDLGRHAEPDEVKTLILKKLIAVQLEEKANKGQPIEG
jgi:selenoprotein W-related protein